MQSGNSCRNKAFGIATHRRLYIPRSVWPYADLFPLQISLVLTDAYPFHFSRSIPLESVQFDVKHLPWIVKRTFEDILRILSGATSSFLGNWNNPWYDRTIQWYRALTMRYLRRKLRRIRDPSNRSYPDRVEFRALRMALQFIYQNNDLWIKHESWKQRQEIKKTTMKINLRRVKFSILIER